MKNFLCKWLGLNALTDWVQKDTYKIENMEARLRSLETDFNSRETCKICGRHRYNTAECLARSNHDELEKVRRADRNTVETIYPKPAA